MKANNDDELNIIDMDAMATGALPFVDDLSNTEEIAIERIASMAKSDNDFGYTYQTPFYLKENDGEAEDTDNSGESAYNEEYADEPAQETAEYSEDQENDTCEYTEDPASVNAEYIEDEAGYTEDTADFSEDTAVYSDEAELSDNEAEYIEETAEFSEEPAVYADDHDDPDADNDNGGADDGDTYDGNEWPTRFGSLQILPYFVLFFVTILYYEFLIRLDISGSITKTNLPLLAFIPAQALFCASLCGWFKKHPRINGILSAVIVFGLGFYYFAQLIYFRLSGSLLSVSLMNMGGEAMGNFGWTIRDILIKSIPHLLLMCIPLIAAIVLSFIHLPSEKEGRPALLPGGAYKLWLHPLLMAAAFGLWTIGGVFLAFGGRDRDSAYYVFKDSLADTDSSSTRLGTLTTTLVEASAYYLGTDTDTSSSITAVDMAAIDLGKKSSPAPSSDVLATGKEAAGSESENTASENLITMHEWADEDIDFDALKEYAKDATTTSLCEYFASRVPTSTNEYTGLFEGHNLIYICAEAFSNYGIDKDITPTLYKMANNGVVLENFYNSFPNTTTNGEFAFATSLWPDVSRFAQAGTAVGSFPQSANVFMPYGLGDLFDSEEGVESYAYHNYYGDYYKRCYSWPNLGYQHMKFLGSGMVFTSTWPASDLEMINQSVDDYVDRERFMSYYMTFSGHGPYNSSNYMYRKNIDAVRERANGKFKSDEVLGYFCGEYELELAMEELLKRLDEAGQLDNTVIVLIGDHYPYYLSDAAVTEINGGTAPDAFEKNHSTCIIYNAGLKEPVKCDTYCCNVDILPTILNLFNINFDSRMYMGTDVFSDGIHRARLYNGSFITEYVTYDKASGKKTWSDAASEFSEKELDAYFEAMLDYTSSEYSAALNLIKTNFYFFTWKNSGLLTEEEANAELAREESSKRIYADEAAAEAARLAAEAAAAAAAAEAEAAAQQQQQPQPQPQPQEEEYLPDHDPDPNWQPDPSWFED